jgi:GGDEF domain-containing protein
MIATFASYQSLVLRLCLCIPVPLLMTASVCGQQAQIQILGVGEAQDGEAGARIAEGLSSMSFAAGGSTGFSFSSLGGGVDPFNRSQLFNLLSNESVRLELGLTEDQFKGSETIKKASQKRLSSLVREQLKEASSNGGAIRLGGESFRQLLQQNRVEAEEALEEILLPEQLNRLRQIAYQVDIAQTGLGEALTQGRLGEEIGVHEDQKQNLMDRAAKIEEETRQAILAIRAKARAKLFAELTPEQRKQALERLGDYFQYEEPSLSQQLRKSFQSVSNEESEIKED